MAKFDLKQYARRGAEARAAELQAELEGIYRAFPDLRAGRGRLRAAAGGETGAPQRRRRTMTAAQRREVSQRMKKYWAARRKAKGD